MSWWTSGGATGAVAVYQPIGAASLAASYSNLANPGTYDAAPGVAPSFDTATGWTFNGSTQYLTTVAIPAAGYSIIARYSDVSTFGALCGYAVSPPYSWIFVHDGGKVGYGYGSADTRIATSNNSGVLCVTPVAGYQDGALHVSHSSPSWSGTTGALYIGGANQSGAVIWALAGKIQAFAIYNTTLDASQVAAVTTAMNALPTAAASFFDPPLLIPSLAMRAY